MPRTLLMWRVEVALAGSDVGAGVWDTGRWDQTTWSGQDPTWIPVTGDVITVATSMGRDRWTDRMRTGSARTTLANETGRWSPDHGADPPGVLALRPGRWIRLSVNGGDGWRPQHVGYVDTIDEAYSDGATLITTTITSYDLTSRMAADDPPALTAAVGGNERTDQRISRVLDVYGWSPDARTIQEGAHRMTATTLARTPYEECQRAAQAEGTAFWADGAGAAQFRRRDWLQTDPRSSAPQMRPGHRTGDTPTVGEPHVIGLATEWTGQIIANDIQFSRVGGQTIRLQNAVSQQLYGRRTVRRTDLEVTSDLEVVGLAGRYLADHAHDRQRIRSLTVWPSDSDAAEKMADTRIGDRVEATVTTLRGWSYTTDAWVQGISWSATADDTTLTIRVDDVAAYDPEDD